MAIEIVDLAINSMVDLASSLCKRLPFRVNHDKPVDSAAFFFDKAINVEVMTADSWWSSVEFALKSSKINYFYHHVQQRTVSSQRRPQATGNETFFLRTWGGMGGC